jgi:hypothetical protein
MATATHTSQSQQSSSGKANPLSPRQDAPADSARAPKLMDRPYEAFRSRHYNRRKEQAYGHWVKRFIVFHNVRHPAEMAESEINAFLTHLAVREKVSASTQNQTLAAFLSLYRHVIDHQVGSLGQIIRAHKPERPPVVMTRREVDVKTTMIYTHVLNRGPSGVRSPIDGPWIADGVGPADGPADGRWGRTKSTH